MEQKRLGAPLADDVRIALEKAMDDQASQRAEQLKSKGIVATHVRGRRIEVRRPQQER